jgi:hypothetical protein
MTRISALVGVMVVGLAAGGVLLGDDTKQEAPAKAKGTLPANWSKLGLTDQQKQKIYSARAEYRTKIDELRNQIRQLENAERVEMEKVLTDAQKARLREILTEKAPGASPAKDDKKPDAKPASETKKP